MTLIDAKSPDDAAPEFADRFNRIIPLGELQTVEQIAKAAAFLCSAEADAITGAVLLVDGGTPLLKLEWYPAQHG